MSEMKQQTLEIGKRKFNNKKKILATAGFVPFSLLTHSPPGKLCSPLSISELIKCFEFLRPVFWGLETQPFKAKDFIYLFMSALTFYIIWSWFYIVNDCQRGLNVMIIIFLLSKFDFEFEFLSHFPKLRLYLQPLKWPNDTF